MLFSTHRKKLINCCLSYGNTLFCPFVLGQIFTHIIPGWRTWMVRASWSVRPPAKSLLLQLMFWAPLACQTLTRLQSPALGSGARPQVQGVWIPHIQGSGREWTRTVPCSPPLDPRPHVCKVGLISVPRPALLQKCELVLGMMFAVTLGRCSQMSPLFIYTTAAFSQYCDPGHNVLLSHDNQQRKYRKKSCTDTAEQT